MFGFSVFGVVASGRKRRLSGEKFDLCEMAVRVRESPVARDERRSKALGEGDVYAVGCGVRAAQLVGALDETLCRPTSERQTLEIRNSDKPFVIADQPTHDRATDSTDHLDIDVGGGMHGLASQSLHHSCPRLRGKD